MLKSPAHSNVATIDQSTILGLTCYSDPQLKSVCSKNMSGFTMTGTMASLARATTGFPPCATRPIKLLRTVSGTHRAARACSYARKAPCSDMLSRLGQIAFSCCASTMPSSNAVQPPCIVAQIHVFWHNLQNFWGMSAGWLNLKLFLIVSHATPAHSTPARLGTLRALKPPPQELASLKAVHTYERLLEQTCVATVRQVQMVNRPCPTCGFVRMLTSEHQQTTSSCIQSTNAEMCG